MRSTARHVFWERRHLGGKRVAFTIDRRFGGHAPPRVFLRALAEKQGTFIDVIPALDVCGKLSNAVTITVLYAADRAQSFREGACGPG